MTSPLHAIAACMRNEGQFLLEWVAYHRAIGFDRVFVATNDCSDGTDTMLDRLAEIDAVHHIRNDVPPGTAPQVAGMSRILAHPAMAGIDWLLHCDADEFLDVTVGTGRVADLTAAISPADDPADVIALCWQPMGSGGLKDWPGGSVIETFTRTARNARRDSERHKSLFRPALFAAAIDHMPKSPRRDSLMLKDSAGTRLNPRALFHPTHSQFRRNGDIPLTWANARIRHYAVKSEDIFLMKNIRGDGMGIASDKYHLGSLFWKRGDRNRREDRAMHRHLPATRAIWDRYLSDPVLGPLDRAAQNWFRNQRALHLTEDRRRAWTTTTPQEDARP